MLTRCSWAAGSEIEQVYHDQEWGVPCWDDQRQFEFLLLESAQAGLSWRTILNKRQGYSRAFAGFNAAEVARFGPAQAAGLMNDTGIVRNARKIQAAINNARCFLQLQERYGSFCNYLWKFVDGRPIVNTWRESAQVPAQTALSQTIAKDMKQHGFTFLGPVVLYAHLQATGLVNDHLVSCFRYQQLLETYIVD